jgi:hypothetical protein
MEFYLKYDGPLKSNGSAQDKHSIREYFYPQLKNLWGIKPLSKRKNFLKHENKPSILQEIDGIIFAPLICNALEFICQLDITMLWPEEQGVISKVGGDIDNRLKTLFDALQCPDANQIKPVKERFADKQPFFCLLEDDKLITSVNVRTHTLLRVENKNNVSVLIHVMVKALDTKIGAIGLSG